MPLKVGDRVIIKKIENGYYICCSSEPRKDACRRCNLFNEKPCRVIKTCPLTIDVNVDCVASFYSLSEDNQEKYFTKIKRLWRKL